jgi:hypothetical protein
LEAGMAGVRSAKVREANNRRQGTKPSKGER